MGEPPSSCLVHLTLAELLLFTGVTSSMGEVGSPAQDRNIIISYINMFSPVCVLDATHFKFTRTN